LFLKTEGQGTTKQRSQEVLMADFTRELRTEGQGTEGQAEILIELRTGRFRR
jgi:hypothetical protein